MRGLSGDFATMPLRDLVVYLGNRRHTGRLDLERDGVHKQVVLEDGAVINASSNIPREYLGQFLINLGHITEEQFERAYATQRETKVFLGRILVMIGLVSEETVQGALLVKFRETLLEAFNWPEGTFAFEPTPAEPSEGLEVRLPLLEVYKESELRVQAWAQIYAAFPRGDLTFRLRREMLVEPPRPGSLDERLFQFIEQGQTLDEMALRLHATDFFLYNRLFAFYRLGALEVASPREMEFDVDVDLGLGDSPTAEQILENARAFLAQGNLRDAYALGRRSNQMTATLDAALLLKQVEVAWLPQLKAELMGKARVPVLKVQPEALSKLPLSAPERYLLSRVDGKRNIGAIIRVAPLKEFEALAYFDRFSSQRWVTWLETPVPGRTSPSRG
jgi:Domain of unknown function (DUF4388)